MKITSKYELAKKTRKKVVYGVVQLQMENLIRDSSLVFIQRDPKLLNIIHRILGFAR